MKILRRIIYILFLSLSAASAQQLNIATYNIRNNNQGDIDKGNGWKYRLPVIAEIIKYYEFDVFQRFFHGQSIPHSNHFPVVIRVILK